jgi:hypothetical protein
LPPERPPIATARSFIPPPRPPPRVQVNSRFALLPTAELLREARRVDAHGELWLQLRAANNQPEFT